MALTRLSCPECGTVLRPAKPVSAGQKVKCPKCKVVFAARDDDEDFDDVDEVEEARPRKAAGKASARKPAPPAVKDQKKKASEEDNETYGYIKEPEDEDDSKKPKVDWEAKVKQRDPRGPAIVALTPPATKLQLVGMACVFGWLGLMLLLIIPACFPIKEDPKPEGFVRPPDEKDKKKEPPRQPFFKVYGVDLYEHVVSKAWYIFLLLMIPLAAGAIYSALVVAGGIKMQNLESRAWGITAAVMAIIPLNVMGVQTLLALIIHYLLNLIMDDPEYPQHVSMGLNALVWLASAAIGGWSLRVLNDEAVIEGFEYEPE